MIIRNLAFDDLKMPRDLQEGLQENGVFYSVQA